MPTLTSKINVTAVISRSCNTNRLSWQAGDALAMNAQQTRRCYPRHMGGIGPHRGTIRPRSHRKIRLRWKSKGVTTTHKRTPPVSHTSIGIRATLRFGLDCSSNEMRGHTNAQKKGRTIFLVSSRVVSVLSQRSRTCHVVGTFTRLVQLILTPIAIRWPHATSTRANNATRTSSPIARNAQPKQPTSYRPPGNWSTRHC